MTNVALGSDGKIHFSVMSAAQSSWQQQTKLESFDLKQSRRK